MPSDATAGAELTKESTPSNPRIPPLINFNQFRTYHAPFSIGENGTSNSQVHRHSSDVQQPTVRRITEITKHRVTLGTTISLISTGDDGGTSHDPVGHCPGVAGWGVDVGLMDIWGHIQQLVRVN
jgi:hypothetical protein